MNITELGHKTEVMVFSGSGTSVNSLIDMSSLAQYHKQIITNLGVKVDTRHTLSLTTKLKL